jgi:hypothetical protein
MISYSYILDYIKYNNFMVNYEIVKQKYSSFFFECIQKKLDNDKIELKVNIDTRNLTCNIEYLLENIYYDLYYIN